MQGFKKQATATVQHSMPATVDEGVLITASASTNTKGSWTELIASTTYDSFGFWLKFTASFTAATIEDILADIGIGAAASEVVLMPNLMVGARADTQNFGGLIFIPLFIPKGTRVAARCQSNIASNTVRMNIIINGAQSEGQAIYVGCDAYGVNTGTSAGTVHTSASTRSAKASVGSTLSRDYSAITLGIGVNLTVQNSRTVIAFLSISGGVDMAAWIFTGTTSEYLFGPVPDAPVPLRLASGSQLEVSMDTVSGTDSYKVAYYCFY